MNNILGTTSELSLNRRYIGLHAHLMNYIYVVILVFLKAAC